MTKSPSRHVLISANSSWNLANFRYPIIKAMRERGIAVSAAVPDRSDLQKLRDLDVEIHPVPVDARGLSPAHDGRLLFAYYQLLRKVRPTAFLTFTPKPNIYGSMAGALARVPVVSTVTGLGTGFLTGRALQALMTLLYQTGLRHAHWVFFHNAEDRTLFIRKKIVKEHRATVVAGSGVNLDRFAPVGNVGGRGGARFLFIGRLLKDKGAMEFAQAASIVRKSFGSATFQMLGTAEDHPKAVRPDELAAFQDDGSIELIGPVDDVRSFIAAADCVALPSYREGLPRVLLEASAMARPVIATDVPGCRDAVDHGVTGLLCAPRSAASLADAMIEFLKRSPEDRARMGAQGRQKAEREFSEERVIEAYLDALQELGL